MGMKVLQNKVQIRNARQDLKKMGVSSTESIFRSLLRRLGLVKGILVGDDVKSWDVLSTLNFIKKNTEFSEPILDIGCYASEVIIALHRLGYTNLSGIDLNPDLKKMPHHDFINYVTNNFMQTQFENAAFSVITSISVIEHGFEGKKLLEEISRLLKPGGYFIASFDYWPEKIATEEIKFFDMEWLIFSKKDIADFVNQAAKCQLSPISELHYESDERTMDCAGKQYTFGWLVLKKQ